MEYILRAALPSDQPFLWEMLYFAAHMAESNEPPELARTNPDLTPYVEDFGRPGDLGVIALDAAAGARAGAAWIRVMPPGWPLYRFVDAGMPELAIAMTPAHSGRGAGQMMLARLLTEAAAIHSAVVLSVRENNPAKNLYQRIGFTVVAEITNRVGGRSLIMQTALARSCRAPRDV